MFNSYLSNARLNLLIGESKCLVKHVHMQAIALVRALCLGKEVNCKDQLKKFKKKCI